MKYGESAFDILYLLFTIISGIMILSKAGTRLEKRMGAAALILGCGDAFHLVPRVLNYFVDADFTALLGVGKLITSITMTLFYVLLYYIWIVYYKQQVKTPLISTVWVLTVLRIILCLFPQNGWFQNDSNMAWGIIRNIPFAMLGGIICRLYYSRRRNKEAFRFMWIYILMSFLFYIPVAVGAGMVPVLGMLMLPKTICYILMVCSFLSVCRGRRKLRSA